MGPISSDRGLAPALAARINAIAEQGGDRYYNRRGEQITYLEHAARTQADVVVGRTSLGPSAAVMTSCLGHDVLRTSPPMIFETLVYSSDPALDLHTECYATEQDAAAGHARWVARLRAAEGLPPVPPATAPGGTPDSS